MISKIDAYSIHNPKEQLARVGGPDHRLPLVQLPDHLAMPEAASRRNRPRGEAWMQRAFPAFPLGL